MIFSNIAQDGALCFFSSLQPFLPLACAWFDSGSFIRHSQIEVSNNIISPKRFQNICLYVSASKCVRSNYTNLIIFQPYLMSRNYSLPRPTLTSFLFTLLRNSLRANWFSVSLETIGEVVHKSRRDSDATNVSSMTTLHRHITTKKLTVLFFLFHFRVRLRTNVMSARKKEV